MDCTGRKGAEEALKKQNSCQSDFQDNEADARCSKAEGSASGNLNRPSTDKKDAMIGSSCSARKYDPAPTLKTKIKTNGLLGSR